LTCTVFDLRFIGLRFIDLFTQRRHDAIKRCRKRQTWFAKPKSFR
jgi:hypothetical protein